MGELSNADMSDLPKSCRAAERKRIACVTKCR
jgi:hypothetical protein